MRFLMFFFLLGFFSINAAAEQRPAPVKSVNLWQPGDLGERMYIDGRITDSAGEPLAGAVIHVRQADGRGSYQPDRYRARMVTDEAGRYAFGTVLPGSYIGVKHIHVLVEHEFFPPLETEIIFKGDPNLDRSSEERAIFLEKAGGDQGDVLYGRFDVVLKLPGER